jgi:serine/threonine protein kinase
VCAVRFRATGTHEVLDAAAAPAASIRPRDARARECARARARDGRRVVDLIAGTVVGGQFEVVRPLAQGGMGAVCLARQAGTGARRALKVMHPHMLRDRALVGRFEQEARVGSLIPSDHVVHVVAAGVDESALGTLPWIAMELLEGVDLARYIQSRGALATGEFAELCAQLCHALAAAHGVGVVHRDLELENVFLASTRMVGALPMDAVNARAHPPATPTAGGCAARARRRRRLRSARSSHP